MKKRFVAFLLVLVMVLGMLPVSAFAGDGTATPTTGKPDKPTDTDIGGKLDETIVINPVGNGSSGTVTPPDISEMTIWVGCKTGNEGTRVPLADVKGTEKEENGKYTISIDQQKLCEYWDRNYAFCGKHSVNEITRTEFVWSKNASNTWTLDDTTPCRVELYSSTSSAKPSETAPEASRLPTIKFLCPSGCDHDASYLHPNETSMFSAGTRTDTTLEIVWNMDEILQAYQNSLTSNHLSTKNHQWRTVNGKSIDSLTLNWDTVEGAWTSPVLELNAYVQPVPSAPSATLTYDANGSNVKNMPKPVTQTLELPNKVTVFTLSNKIPERIGYKFLGWATSADATTVPTYTAEKLQAGEKLTLHTGNPTVTLYAIWEKDAPRRAHG